MLDKIFTSLDATVADIPDGAAIMIGGFGDVGMPFGLIEALIRHHARDLTLICNHAGRGDLANWKVPGTPMGAIGGAMDIASGAKQVFVAMTHVTAKGEAKIVAQLSYPVTALKCVTRIYTDIAVIDVTREGLVLKEVAPGFSPEDVQAKTEPQLVIATRLVEIAA